MKNVVFSMLLIGSVVFGGTARAAIVVHTTDFIADANRSHFNGFESIPNDGLFFTGGSGPYTEDTIQVQQINPRLAIWVTSNWWTGSEGSFGWYPNGGNDGYTKISVAGGIDFQDVGFNFGSGNVDDTQILYELLRQWIGAIDGISLVNRSLLRIAAKSSWELFLNRRSQAIRGCFRTKAES